VPQESVLGPILFALYVTPVGDIISSYGILDHQYADDTELFLALKAATIDINIHLQNRVHSQAMLNADKSEVMLIGTPLRKIMKHNLLKSLTLRFQL